MHKPSIIVSRDSQSAALRPGRLAIERRNLLLAHAGRTTPTTFRARPRGDRGSTASHTPAFAFSPARSPAPPTAEHDHHTLNPPDALPSANQSQSAPLAYAFQPPFITGRTRAALAVLLAGLSLTAAIVLGSPAACLGLIVGFLWDANASREFRPFVIIWLVSVVALCTVGPLAVTRHADCFTSSQLVMAGVALLAMAAGLGAMLLVSHLVQPTAKPPAAVTAGGLSMGNAGSPLVFLLSSLAASTATASVLLLLDSGSMTHCALGTSLSPGAQMMRSIAVGMVSIVLFSVPTLQFTSMLTTVMLLRSKVLLPAVMAVVFCITLALARGPDSPLLLLCTLVPVASWLALRYTLLASLLLSTGALVGVSVRVRVEFSSAFDLDAAIHMNDFREIMLWYGVTLLLCCVLLLLGLAARMVDGLGVAAMHTIEACSGKAGLFGRLDELLTLLYIDPATSSLLGTSPTFIPRDSHASPSLRHSHRNHLRVGTARDDHSLMTPPLSYSSPKFPDLFHARTTLSSTQEVVPMPTSVNAAPASSQSPDDDSPKPNDSQARFLSSMSHELLTPAHGLIGNAQLLADAIDQIDESLHEVVDDLCRTGDHLYSVLRDVIEYAELSNPDAVLQLNETWFSMGDLLDDVALICSPAVPNRCVEVCISGDEQLMSQSFYGDRDRLLQVVVQIVSNAVKFSPSPGAVLVRVSASSSPPAELSPDLSKPAGSTSPTLSTSGLQPHLHRTSAAATSSADTALALRGLFLRSSLGPDRAKALLNKFPYTSAHRRSGSGGMTRSASLPGKPDASSAEPSASESDLPSQSKYITISIEDRGKGMTESELSAVWHPFTRQGTSYEPKNGGDGAGLGLNIVRLLTERLGGHVSARSQQAVGSTFSVCMPLRVNGGAPGPSAPALQTALTTASSRADPRSPAKLALWTTSPALQSMLLNQLSRSSQVATVECLPDLPTDPTELTALLHDLGAEVLAVAVTIQQGWASPELCWLEQVMKNLDGAELPARLWITLPGVILTPKKLEIELDPSVEALCSAWDRVKAALREASSSSGLVFRVNSRPLRMPRLSHHLMRLMSKPSRRMSVSLLERQLVPGGDPHTLATATDSVMSSPFYMEGLDSLNDPAPSGNKLTAQRRVQHETLQKLMVEERVQRVRCLVVDDNDLNRRLAARMVTKCGVKDLTTAVDGHDAVRQVDEHLAAGTPFHCIFMDVTMPGMDGIQATRVIMERYVSATAPLPRVIALTANTTAADKDACLAVMHSFVGKPFRKAQLKHELLECCRELVPFG